MLWLAGDMGHSLLIRPGLWWVWLQVLILGDRWQGEPPSRAAHGPQEVVLALHRWSPASVRHLLNLNVSMQLDLLRRD